MNRVYFYIFIILFGFSMIPLISSLMKKECEYTFHGHCIYKHEIGAN